MTKRHMKYNPSFLSEAELIESFVVRHADLDLIIRIIDENVTDSNQHVLVIGPRGSGKTTLVHRVAAEIEQNKELRDRWYPLIFSEESYEVVSTGEFWLEALFHLFEQTENEKWKQTYEELKKETDDQKLAERALAQLLDFADSQGRKILLIVENLNMLFNDLISEEEAWKIRHTLMNESRVMLLATATNRFEHIENSSKAMFEMFKLQELKPLDDDECNRIWELITGQRLSGDRIRPVRILTGGNPRLLTIIAKFGAHRSFRKLLDDLVDLIDDHTEYFKSHLDNLPAIERKVYLALAGLWDASTAREIAQAARLNVNKTSSLLGRLKSRGAVIVEERGKKIKWYVVAERMYNIYYLMRRHGKQADRVKATVKFMVSMYDPESAARLITEEACGLTPEVCSDHYLAFEETIKQVSSRQLLEKIITSTPKAFLESFYLGEKLKDILTLGQKMDVKEGYNDREVIELKEAEKLREQGINLIKDGNHEQAIEKFNEVIRKFDHVNKLKFLQLVITALRFKGFALSIFGRPEEAIAIYDEVIERFGDAEEAVIRQQVAMAMANKGVTFGRLNRFEGAVAVYDDVVARFGDAEEAAICELVAGAMVNKGVTLRRLNRFDEAAAVYDEVVERFGDSEETVIRELVAGAMVNKGVTLWKLNRFEGAVAVYDDVVVRFGDSEEAVIRQQVAGAMVNKGVTFGELNRFEEEIAVYDEVIVRFGDSEEAVIRQQVAMAMANKGVTFGELNRFEEEIAVYDEVVVRFGDSEDAAIRKHVARVMVNKGITLGRLNRFEDAIAVDDDVVVRFGDSEEAVIRQQVAMAMANKGVTFGELNRFEEEIAVYDEVVVRFGDSEDAAIREKVARAMYNKGLAFGELNRFDEAVAVYDEVVARFGDAEESAIQEQVAMALFAKGVTLDSLDKYKEAEKAFRKAIEVKPDFFLANINLIKLLLKIPERFDDAIQTAEEIIGRKPDNSGLLNGIAWTFYKHGEWSLLLKAENWSQQAVSLSPEDASAYHHTLACILGALNKGSEALEWAGKYIQDVALVEKSIEDAIELFVALAVSGKAREALGILVDSPLQKHLEPLVAGLKLYIGEDVKTATEIREVAKDVVKRIEERLKKHENFKEGLKNYP